MEEHGQLIVIAGALLASGVVVSRLADRLRLPGLVLFLGRGMVARRLGLIGGEPEATD